MHIETKLEVGANSAKIAKRTSTALSRVLASMALRKSAALVPMPAATSSSFVPTLSTCGDATGGGDEERGMEVEEAGGEHHVVPGGGGEISEAGRGGNSTAGGPPLSTFRTRCRFAASEPGRHHSDMVWKPCV